MSLQDNLNRAETQADNCGLTAALAKSLFWVLITQTQKCFLSDKWFQMEILQNAIQKPCHPQIILDSSCVFQTLIRSVFSIFEQNIVYIKGEWSMYSYIHTYICTLCFQSLAQRNETNWNTTANVS